MFILIQALLYIMYKLVEDGPSREADEIGEFVSIYTCGGVSGREYRIQFIYEEIFFFFFCISSGWLVPSFLIYFFKVNLRICACQED